VKLRTKSRLSLIRLKETVSMGTTQGHLKNMFEFWLINTITYDVLASLKVSLFLPATSVIKLSTLHFHFSTLLDVHDKFPAPSPSVQFNHLQALFIPRVTLNQATISDNAQQSEFTSLPSSILWW